MLLRFVIAGIRKLVTRLHFAI